MPRTRWLGVVAIFCAGVIFAQAQSASPETAAGTQGNQGKESEASALAVRQERVRTFMQEIPPRLLDLARSLEETEPQRATRLKEAIARLQQLRIDQQMAETAKLLAGEKLDAAGTSQVRIQEQIEELITLLLAEDQVMDPALAELLELEARLRALDELIAGQTRLQDRLQEQMDVPGRLRELDALVQKIQMLIQKQRELQEATQKNRQEMQGEPGPMAQVQTALADQTQKAQKQSVEVARDAAARLEEAGAQQRKAGELLEQGRGQAAEQAQQAALQALNQALEEVNKERQRIKELEGKSIDRLAPQQEELAQKTGELNQQQAQSGQGQNGQAPGGGAGEDSGSEGQAGGDSPGKAAAEQAQQAMKQAGASLRRKEAAQAQQAQAQARKLLEDARDQVEERLKQLRQQTMEERLAGLEERFEQMLQRQRLVSGSTTALAETNKASWTRAQWLACEQLGREEMELAGLAQQCLDVLRDDATTVVFPRLVQQLHADMQQAGQWLGEQKADDATVGLQREIEASLVELLEAVKIAQEHLQQMNQAGQQGEQQPGTPALAPPSAELKLLKAAQLRINSRTSELHMAGKMDGNQTSRAQELARLARRQEEARDLARKLAEQ